MFDVSSSELLLILAVAAVVIGPKDLPVVAKAIGKIIIKLKRASREFMRALEEAAEDTGIKAAIDEVNKGGLSLQKIIGDDGKEYEAYDVSEVEKELGVTIRKKPAAKKSAPKSARKTKAKRA